MSCPLAWPKPAVTGERGARMVPGARRQSLRYAQVQRGLQRTATQSKRLATSHSTCRTGSSRNGPKVSTTLPRVGEFGQSS